MKRFYTIGLFLPVFMLLVLPLYAASIQQYFQFYSDSKNLSLQSHILKYDHEFYFIEDFSKSTRIVFQYKLDQSEGGISAQDQENNINQDKRSNVHGLSLNLSQGIFSSTTILANIASSFNDLSFGGALNQRFRENTTSVLVGFNRVKAKKPVETFLNRELVQIETSDELRGTDIYTSLTQTLTKTTMARIQWRFVERNEQANAQVISGRIHQWLPTNSSLQAEYSFFFNTGDLPATSQLGKLNAHIVDLAFYQYLTSSTIAKLRYRFYREAEQIEANFSNILGSDLYGIKLTQDFSSLLKKWGILKSDFLDKVNFDLSLDRYANNKNEKAWMMSTGVSFVF